MTRSKEITMLTATPTSTLQTIVNVKVRNMSARSIHDRILGMNARLSVSSTRQKESTDVQ